MRFIVGQYVLHCLVVGSDGMVQPSLEWAQWVVEVLPSLVSSRIKLPSRDGVFC